MKLLLHFCDANGGSETLPELKNKTLFIMRLQLHSRLVHLDMNPGPPLSNYCSTYASHFQLTAAGRQQLKEYLHTFCSCPSANNDVLTAGNSEPLIKAVAESTAALQLPATEQGKWTRDRSVPPASTVLYFTFALFSHSISVRIVLSHLFP